MSGLALGYQVRKRVGRQIAIASRLAPTRVSGWPRDSCPPPIPCGSRACPRWRRHSQHHRKPTHRLREQARSHKGFGVAAGLVSAANPLWEPGLPAMAAAQPTSSQADPPTSRAGSLPQVPPTPQTPVGASLLAIAANLPTQNLRTTAAPAPALRGSSGRCGCAG